MRRIVGFALFFAGIGIVIGMAAPCGMITFLLAVICLLLGYQLFCGC